MLLSVQNSYVTRRIKRRTNEEIKKEIRSERNSLRIISAKTSKFFFTGTEVKTRSQRTILNCKEIFAVDSFTRFYRAQSELINGQLTISFSCAQSLLFVLS